MDNATTIAVAYVVQLSGCVALGWYLRGRFKKKSSDHKKAYNYNVQVTQDIRNGQDHVILYDDIVQAYDEADAYSQVKEGWISKHPEVLLTRVAVRVSLTDGSRASNFRCEGSSSE